MRRPLDYRAALVLAAMAGASMLSGGVTRVYEDGSREHHWDAGRVRLSHYLEDRASNTAPSTVSLRRSSVNTGTGATVILDSDWLRFLML
jgi:hypothetical protein